MGSKLTRLVRNARKPLVVSPRLDDYLLKNPERFPLSERTLRLITEVMAGKPRDRSGGFSGSARGNCERAQVFSYIGVKQARTADSVLNNLFDDGSWRHLRWQALMLEANLADDIEVPAAYEILPGIWVKGSLDGVGSLPLTGDLYGIEIKGIRTLNWVEKEPKHEHLLQVHSYMLMTGLRHFVILYEDKACQEWVEYDVDYDPIYGTMVLQELEELAQAVQAKTLPGVLKGCENGKGKVFNDCSYNHICLQTTDWQEALRNIPKRKLAFKPIKGKPRIRLGAVGGVTP